MIWDKVIYLYNQGYEVRRVAELCRTSPMEVVKWLQAEGVTIRPEKDVPVTMHQRTTSKASQTTDHRSLLVVSGSTAKRTSSARTGKPSPALPARERFAKDGTGFRQRALSPSEEKELVMQYVDGITLPKIAERFNICVRTVVRYARANGLIRDPRKAKRWQRGGETKS